MPCVTIDLATIHLLGSRLLALSNLKPPWGTPLWGVGGSYSK